MPNFLLFLILVRKGSTCTDLAAAKKLIKEEKTGNEEENKLKVSGKYLETLKRESQLSNKLVILDGLIWQKLGPDNKIYHWLNLPPLPPLWKLLGRAFSEGRQRQLFLDPFPLVYLKVKTLLAIVYFNDLQHLEDFFFLLEKPWTCLDLESESEALHSRTRGTNILRWQFESIYKSKSTVHGYLTLW